MANLKAIRTRISSVKSTQQITKAMKMVAAAKLRRAQEALFKGRPYANNLTEMIRRLAANAESEEHPLFRNSTSSRTLLLLVTSDRGLCGAFNSNINRTAENFIKENKDTLDSIDLAFIGRKGRDYFKNRGQRLGTPTAHYFQDLFTQLNMESVRDVAETLIQEFIDAKYDRVYIIYNEFKSTISQNVVVEKLLPIAPASDDTNEDSESQSNREYIYEPNQKELFEHLLPLHVSTLLFGALRESFAAEMGARMAAMESATNNARDMIANLTLIFNRARQAAITTEIIEIVSGAEAL